MTLSYCDLMATERTAIEAQITTDHCASHYGQPVIVLPDGEALDYLSFIMLGYRVEQLSPHEAALLKRWWKNCPPLMLQEIQRVRGHSVAAHGLADGLPSA